MVGRTFLFCSIFKDIKTTRKYYDREIRALSAVHQSSGECDNIIRCVQFGEDSDSGYIFTPYLAHGNLHDYVAMKGGLPELEALEIFEQVVDGVKTVHSANVTHSDLKVRTTKYFY